MKQHYKHDLGAHQPPPAVPPIDPHAAGAALGGIAAAGLLRWLAGEGRQ